MLDMGAGITCHRLWSDEATGHRPTSMHDWGSGWSRLKTPSHMEEDVLRSPKRACEF